MMHNTDLREGDICILSTVIERRYSVIRLYLLCSGRTQGRDRKKDKNDENLFFFF